MHGPIAIARTIDLMLMVVDMQGAALWIPGLARALPDQDRVARRSGTADRLQRDDRTVVGRPAAAFT